MCVLICGLTTKCNAGCIIILYFSTNFNVKCAVVNKTVIHIVNGLWTIQIPIFDLSKDMKYRTIWFVLMSPFSSEFHNSHWRYIIKTYICFRFIKLHVLTILCLMYVMLCHVCERWCSGQLAFRASPIYIFWCVCVCISFI